MKIVAYSKCTCYYCQKRKLKWKSTSALLIFHFPQTWFSSDW